MTAVKKKLLIVLTCVAILFAGIAILSACSGDNGDLKVTFMVQSDDGSWGKYDEKAVTDGSVEMPANPTKEYYTFTNWYSDKDFSGDPFTGKDLKESATVYARFIPVEVDIYINGKDEGTQNLIDVVNGTYDPGENLEFDGWYTNANYTEASKWNGTDTVNTLYARSVARITFNDGYKDVYTTTVTPNTVFADPATSGVETAEIQQTYMSKYDISYWDEDGNEFDFSEPITENTTINVKWRSPFLHYEENPSTGNLIVTMNRSQGNYDNTETEATLTNVPVISVLSEITFDKDEDGVTETYQVDGIALNGKLVDSTVLEKLIIGEGIVSVQGVVGNNASSVKEIVLPSTLKVLINSFNNLGALEKVELPEGLEVIINCFWAKTTASYSYLAGNLNKGEEYSFEIAVPDSVKNLSAVPYNLTFSKTKDTAKTGDFYKEDNRIYKIDDAKGHEGDLLLIADFTSTSGSIAIPEGVNGVQVGALFNRNYTSISLPSTFTYVGYNANAKEYPEYYAEAGSYYSAFLLWNDIGVSERSQLSPGAYAIFNLMEGIDSLTFYGEQPKGDFGEYAFIGDTTGWAAMMEGSYMPYTNSALSGVVFDLNETETPVATIIIKNSLTGSSYQAEVQKNKNEILTLAEILSATDTANDTIYSTLNTNSMLRVVSIINFGEAYDLNSPLTKNVYLTITVDLVNVDGGYTYKDNGDNTATITGFDSTTAKKAEDGLYIVSIPSKIGNLTVTAIAENAFNATIAGNSNNYNIGYVSIPGTVKTIGEKAFYMCSGISSVRFASGSLETIGASAFEDTSLTTVTLPLANLKEVGAYAFKIETLVEFLPFEGEENRDMLTKSDLKTGDFFIRYATVITGLNEGDSSLVGIGLYRYDGKEDIDGVPVYNVTFVASAGAAWDDAMLFTIDLGEVTEYYVIRYTVGEGSFYYLTVTDYSSSINFNAVAKIEKNAFTDCEYANDLAWGTVDFYYSPNYLVKPDAARPTLAQLIDSNEQVFADGWWEGYTDEGLGAKTVNEIN